MTEEQVRVLVVDEEESVRNLLQRILGEAGYQVTTADDGKEALYRVPLGEAVEEFKGALIKILRRA